MERVLTTRANKLCGDFDITFITYNQGERKDYFPLDKRIHRKDIPANNDIDYRAMLAHVLKQERYDITVSTGGAEFFFLHNIKDGSKKIFEFHFSFDISKVWLSGIRNKYKRWIYIKGQTLKRIYHARKYDQIVALCKTDAKKWRRYCRDVTYIFNPLTIQTDKHSDCSSKKVIAVGRLHKQKGFDYLIDAWSLIFHKHPDWTLEIYGEGGLRKALQTQIDRLGLSDVVLLKGKTDDIVSKYIDSSIFVLSSRDEAFGLVITEAEACGLPIVSFDCPSAPAELVEDGVNGYVVRLGDVEDFSSRVMALMVDEGLRQRMGRESMHVAKQFDADAIAGEWKRLYEQLKTS
jgi:glycosyltransferase involved in cell wall biosynthesis